MNNVTRISTRNAEARDWSDKDARAAQAAYELQTRKLAVIMADLVAKDVQERRQMLYNLIGFAIYLGVCAGGVFAYIQGWIG